MAFCVRGLSLTDSGCDVTLEGRGNRKDNGCLSQHKNKNYFISEKTCGRYYSDKTLKNYSGIAKKYTFSKKIVTQENYLSKRQ